MNKLEKIQWGSLTLSEIGILIFWIAGFHGKEQLAAYSFLAAGIFAFIALSAIGLLKLRQNHGFY